MRSSSFAFASILTGLTLGLTLGLAGTALAADDHGDPVTPRSYSRCGTPEGKSWACHTCRAAAPGRRVVYLNRFGGTYSPGETTNASTNSIELSGATGGTIPPLPDNYDWAFITQCVRDYYADYNVEFTEVEPTEGQYLEAVVGGANADIGFNDDGPLGILLGVASTSDVCDVEERGIAFNFAKNHDSAFPANRRNPELCITIAHEVGHLLGLEHEAEASDLMSYIEQDEKGFQDIDSQCGTGVAPGPIIDCRCDVINNVQNSNDVLLANVGPNESEPPMVTVTAPAEGAQVNPTFAVTVTATDDTGVARVELLVDGESVGTDANAPYAITAMRVPTGPRVLTVRAYDLSGNVGAATVNVTVVAECEGTGQSTCDDGEECQSGICLVSLGGECVGASDCASGVCVATNQTDRICSQDCDPAGAACPNGFSCSTDGACLPSDGDGGGCCSVVGPRRDPVAGGAGLLGMLVLGGFLIVRRRRAARRS